MPAVDAPDFKVVYDYEGRPACGDHELKYCEQCKFFTGFFEGSAAELDPGKEEEGEEGEPVVEFAPASFDRYSDPYLYYCSICQLNWLAEYENGEWASWLSGHQCLNMGDNLLRECPILRRYPFTNEQLICNYNKRPHYDIRQDAIAAFVGIASGNDKTAVSAFFGERSEYNIAQLLEGQEDPDLLVMIKAALMPLRLIRVSILPTLHIQMGSEPHSPLSSSHSGYKFGFHVTIAIACQELVEIMTGSKLKQSDQPEGWTLRTNDVEVKSPQWLYMLYVETENLAKQGFWVTWYHVEDRYTARADNLAIAVLPKLQLIK